MALISLVFKDASFGIIFQDLLTALDYPRRLLWVQRRDQPILHENIVSDIAYDIAYDICNMYIGYRINIVYQRVGEGALTSTFIASLINIPSGLGPGNGTGS